MKISIITPSYNQGHFIEKTILSVLNQKWDFDLEYIIIDWLSTDKSVEVIKQYEQKIKSWKFKANFKNLEYKWISEKDAGQSNAINKWLTISTWDIVTYINSDDTYTEWSLQIVSNYFGKSNLKWCYWKCKIIDLDDNEIRRYITLYKNKIWKKYSYSKLLTENFISQMTVFWKREVMNEVWLFDEKNHLCMDYEYWLRIWQQYNPLYINRYLANFRFYHTSKSWSMFALQFKQELEIAKKYAYGRYNISLILHKINYYKIVTIYKLLSLLRK
jgi:glycosyltransferase involved in cell wall biosynthesis